MSHAFHQPATRREDLRLITGAGKYASDWNLPGQAYAGFLRSDRAHARIASINVEHARTHPGVLEVFTGEDAVRAGYNRPFTFIAFTGRNGAKIIVPERPALAHGRVRFVGEPVAMVVAESALAAQDAAELIEVEYEDLPLVVSPHAALAAGAVQLHENVPGNVPLELERGDAAAVEAAFARAAHVSRLTVESTRVTPSPMEPRACLVAFDAGDESYTVHVCLQGMNMMRRQISLYTGVPEDKLRVVAQDVGGGFGQRSSVYVEYAALMIAARALGRSVKWVSTRSEGFLSDTHGRGNLITGELAIDRDGKFLALRIDWITDMGAYLTASGPQGHIRNTITCMTGVYRIPALYGRYRVVLTNTAPVAAFRGAGRPDIAYTIERLVSHAAYEIGIDPVELRRRNFIPPEAFPYKTPTGSTYEYAELEACLDKALVFSDWEGFPARKTQSAARGKLRGIGVACVIENTGAGMFSKDEVQLEAGADGGFTAYSVSHSQGQSHETTFAMVIAGTLGVPIDKVRIRQCPTGRTLIGNHSGGSRTMVGAGSVCKIAADRLIEHGKALAALELGAEPSQVEYAHGAFSLRADKRKVTFADLARSQPVSVTGEGSFGATFPNGCHIAEVEIDPETGVTDIVSYVAVDDCGVVINHAIVEGQVHGAITQGLGQVFGEKIIYDGDSGQLMTGSFMDYYMPRAGMLRNFRLEEHPTPSRVSPLGTKGMGESGCTGSIPALVNAVIDALRPAGVRHLDMPMTPARVWHAIQAAKRTKKER